MRQKIKVVLLDIEGTTTSIKFVNDVLFPYVRKELKSFLERNWDQKPLQESLEALRRQAEDDIKNDLKNVVPIPAIDFINGTELEKKTVIDAVCRNVFTQMDVDRKTTALKQLQGLIWAEGYSKGELKGQ
jgi:enolase-phosphatase E1